ncbi:MAG: lactonase family protein [Pedobacter sp.]|nr:lactonase family protein [Pedobacter sp.]MDQ8053569.1 lactonase family protein [Pedobacter sp.]
MKKLFFILVVCLITMETRAQHHQLFIGTYTNKGNSEGIYVYDFNHQTAATELREVIPATNPSYLALYDKNWLYHVNEDGEFSAVTALKINQKNKEAAKLSFLNSKGKDPCYLIADQKFVLVANYSGGSIAVFERSEKDGSLNNFTQLIKHTGKGVDPKRQSSAHVHQVLFSPDRKYIISTDLGEDQVYLYNYNPDGGNEILTLKKTIKTNAGTGPRHIAFSPDGNFAYLVHEFNGSITAYHYHDGDLDPLQEVATAANDFKGKIDGADIHVSADGKFLYETNRGDANTISVFAISKEGLLSHVETLSTLGKGPRNFTIDPSGNYILVAHQYGNVVIFNRDQATGKLKDSGKRIDVGSPVCLVFNK